MIIKDVDNQNYFEAVKPKTIELLSGKGNLISLLRDITDIHEIEIDGTYSYEIEYIRHFEDYNNRRCMFKYISGCKLEHKDMETILDVMIESYVMDRVFGVGYRRCCSDKFTEKVHGLTYLNQYKEIKKEKDENYNSADIAEICECLFNFFTLRLKDKKYREVKKEIFTTTLFNIFTSFRYINRGLIFSVTTHSETGIEANDLQLLECGKLAYSFGSDSLYLKYDGKSILIHLSDDNTKYRIHDLGNGKMMYEIIDAMGTSYRFAF